MEKVPGPALRRRTEGKRACHGLRRAVESEGIQRPLRIQQIRVVRHDRFRLGPLHAEILRRPSGIGFHPAAIGMHGRQIGPVGRKRLGRGTHPPDRHGGNRRRGRQVSVRLSTARDRLHHVRPRAHAAEHRLPPVPIRRAVRQQKHEFRRPRVGPVRHHGGHPVGMAQAIGRLVQDRVSRPAAPSPGHRAQAPLQRQQIRHPGCGNDILHFVESAPVMPRVRPRRAVHRIHPRLRPLRHPDEMRNRPWRPHGVQFHRECPRRG